MKSFLSLTAIVTLVATPIAAAPKVCAECVKSDMTRLAGPAARGRACGAAEEHAAAGFVAERLKAHGVAPAAPGGGYLQEVRFHVPTYAALPTLTVGGQTFTQGGEIVGMSLGPAASGALVVVTSAADPAMAAGKVVVLDAPYDPRASGALLRGGAVVVIVPASAQVEASWTELAQRPPLYELHRDEVMRVRIANRVDGHDVRVVQR